MNGTKQKRTEPHRIQNNSAWPKSVCVVESDREIGGESEKERENGHKKVAYRQKPYVKMHNNGRTNAMD